jgi:hypothetical protein
VHRTPPTPKERCSPQAVVLRFSLTQGSGSLFPSQRQEGALCVPCKPQARPSAQRRVAVLDSWGLHTSCPLRTSCPLPPYVCAWRVSPLTSLLSSSFFFSLPPPIALQRPTHGETRLRSGQEGLSRVPTCPQYPKSPQSLLLGETILGARITRS